MWKSWIDQGVAKEKGGIWGQRVDEAWGRDEGVCVRAVFPQLCSLMMRVGHW